MDQDAFRKLLSTPKQNSSQRQPQTRGPLLPSKAKDDQKKSTDAVQPAFKPRKVKKQLGGDYRDRALERRTGAAGDFAEVESVLESFEKQHASEDKETVEEHRKYLGGDSEHTVLVKGLDFALLEQTRARIAASSSAIDDEELEEAFRGVTSVSPPPIEQSLTSKKRTREDIVLELKSKQSKGDSNGGGEPVVDKPLDEAKREGKFKPIGFKPIGGSSSKIKEGKEVKKKKKRKVAEDKAGQNAAPTSDDGTKKEGTSTTQYTNQRHPVSASESERKPQPEPEPLHEDFDIFADAGEYEGIDLGDDDAGGDSSDDDTPRRQSEDRPSKSSRNEASPEEDVPSEPRPKRKWVEDGGDELPSLPSRADSKGKEKQSPTRAETSDARHTSPRSVGPQEDGPHPHPELEHEPEPITRLAPLASSSVPSIRDILEADSALESEQKRKARKEKLKAKRGGGDIGSGTGSSGAGGEKKKVSKEAKLNREYQKLKSYTEKKGGNAL